MNKIVGGLTVVAAGILLAACQTTPPTKIPEYTQWRPMLEEQSEVRFVGAHKPRISNMRMRWYRGSVRQEQIFLQTDSTAEASELWMAFAPVAFVEESSAKYHDPKKVRISAVDQCSGAEIGSVAESANVNGPFLYVPCRFVGGDLCILARQGLREVAIQGPEPNYLIHVNFLYCSATETEEQILDRFASLRIGE